ncbi:MAG: DUF481 domain-containing protein [Pirellulales bacterium]|nr:DUF481 domain-containing protein [Pirellulales bacterium]
MSNRWHSWLVAAFVLMAWQGIAQAAEPLLLPPPSGTQPAAGALPAPLPDPAANEYPPSTPWHPPASAAAPEGTPAPAPNSSSSSAESGDPSGVDPTAKLLEERPPTWYERAFLLVPAPWDSGVELGINGSSGTSDSLSIRTGGYIKRESRFSKLDLSSYYNRTASGGTETQNNAQFDVRNDWMMDDHSPWTLFATNNVFYDEFKDFDLQTNVNAGVGYRIFHEKDLELIGRAGGGTSREFGGPDDRWVPESLFGVEYNQKLWATQKLYAKIDYFPEWDLVGEFRLVSDAGWEVELVQPSNLSLKLSITDRYDSTPNDAEPNLLNYSVMLLMKL